MAKKATSKPVPAVVQHAEVSNNINLNLNQNDLIDLAIQEHLEVLEGKLKVVKEEISEKIKINQKLKADAAKGIAQKLLKKDSEYAKTIDLFKTLGVSMNGHDENSKGYRYTPYELYNRNSTEGFIGAYSYYGQEEYSTLSQATRDVRKGSWYKNEFSHVQVKLNYSNNGLTINYSTSVTVESKDTKELCKVLDPLENRLFELYKLKFDLQKEFFEYTFGEKRVKAKIVKASLKKTAEGQAILGMLQGVTGVKLIG